ncbi:hypothetical protein ACFOGJ_17685 [Marinibaculum pumilum]|uniref:Uncharacterized protein n=1 Tax=Marinibaculum pumilum TaxID=1766165 RepID=A0ABV7L4A0_9PROT
MADADKGQSVEISAGDGGRVRPAAAADSGQGRYGQGPAAAQVAQFNTVMRGIYGKARKQLLAATRPVIVVAIGGEVTLLNADGNQETRTSVPPVFHTLKSVGHVVLGLVGAVVPALQGLPDGTGWKQDLKDVAAAIDALEPQLDGLGQTAEQAARQRQMLAAAKDYIATALQEPQPDRAAFTGLMDRIRPLWLADAADAGRMQMVELNRIVQGWRAAMPPEDWARLRVVVLGPRAPRANNAQTRYFARLLGERAPGERVIYAENLFEPAQGMSLLGGVVMDRALSSLVFGNAYRMEEDLMGFAAGGEIDLLLSAATAE